MALTLSIVSPMLDCPIGAASFQRPTRSRNSHAAPERIDRDAPIDGATNRDRSRAFVPDTPVPKPSDTVILDKLGAHEIMSVQRLCRPPCTPGFNPIARAFARLKASLRSVAARAVSGLQQAIRYAFEASAR